MASLNRSRTIGQTYVRFQRTNLLSGEENAVIFKLIDRDSRSLATTVVELYLTDVPYHSDWIKEGTGVLCLLQNKSNEYTLEMYSLEREDIAWRCPLERNINYRYDVPFFHMFESSHCIVGLNFANNLEASNFKDAMLQHVCRYDALDSQLVLTPIPTGNVQKVTVYKNNSKKSRRAGRSQTISISQPTDFKHVAHVSFNSSSFNHAEGNTLLSEIFKLAGVTEDQLKDKNTRDFIVSFVEKRKSHKKYRAPPPPQTTSSVSPTPAENPNVSFKNKKMPTRPPPQPPNARRPENKHHSAVPTPPPPPPPSSILPPAPPSAQRSYGEANHNNAAQSATLEADPPEGRSAFLESIRKGSTLRPVSNRQIKRIDDEELFKNDIAAALSKAIRQRERALQNNDSFSESDLDTDEWDE